MSESRGDMIDKFQKEFEGIWPRDFVNYFKERVLPKANRLGKWALGEVNIYDESFFNHAGKPVPRKCKIKIFKHKNHLKCFMGQLVIFLKTLFCRVTTRKISLEV